MIINKTYNINPKCGWCNISKSTFKLYDFSYFKTSFKTDNNNKTDKNITEISLGNIYVIYSINEDNMSVITDEDFKDLKKKLKKLEKKLKQIEKSLKEDVNASEKNVLEVPSDKNSTLLTLPSTNTYPVVLSSTKFDNDKTKTTRSGIIPYTIMKKRFYFFIGIDGISVDYSDFAGTYEKKDRSLLETAVREFREESLYIYKVKNVKSVKNCLSVYNKESLTIFKYVNWRNFTALPHLFENRLKTINYLPEMKGVVIMTTEDFKTKLETEFYDKISNNIGPVFNKLIKNLEYRHKPAL